ncbi:glycosyltransferase family protein [Lactobacillus helveticus]|uniref:Uncharacterized protein n=1 Tax=Lactobacillus helveticus TaxID=1587 RepID=A0A6A7K243_LACHE|nr:hypothetical protein [Lactobacillus helveticus]MPW14603.1 hypothetical protein [Lactobacillus helveticus]
MPNKYESRLIKKQYEIMQKADVIISIFPESFRQIEKHIPEKTYYLGHIVNALEKYKDNQYNQFRQRNVLFIGSPKYIKGLNLLIKAVANYNKHTEENKKIKLNVIGITKEQVDERMNYDFSNVLGN